MKRLSTLFVLLLACFVLIGCTTPDNSQEKTTYTNLTCTTYVNGETYNYEKIYRYEASIDFNTFCENYGLLQESDYYLIDNYSKWCSVYCTITSNLIDPLPEEEANKLFEDKVFLLFRRKAQASNYLKVSYQFDNENQKIIKSYPYKDESGINTILECLDMIEISKDIYNVVYPKDDSDSFNLTVNDENNLILSELNNTYKAGKLVNVKIRSLLDAGVEVFLDNDSIGEPTLSIYDSGLISFIMPNHDTVLSIRVYDSFNNYNEFVVKYLPSYILSKGIQEEIIYNYSLKTRRINNINIGNNEFVYEKAYIDRYLGYYNNTFAVYMANNVSEYIQVSGEENIDGVLFNYDDANRILAYKNGEFYSLKEAYDNGLLSKEDLIKISNLNNIKEFSITIIDDFDMVINVDELIDCTHKKGDRIHVILKLFSGPRVGIMIDGEEIPINYDAIGNGQMHEFIMPSHYIIIKTVCNGMVSKG